MSHLTWKKNSLRSFEIERRSRHSHKIQPGMQIRLNKLNKFNETLGQSAELWRKKQRIFPPWTSRRTASDVGCEIGTAPESTNGWMNQNDGYPTVGGFLALNMAIFSNKKTPKRAHRNEKIYCCIDYKRHPLYSFHNFRYPFDKFLGDMFLGSPRHT